MTVIQLPRLSARSRKARVSPASEDERCSRKSWASRVSASSTS